LDLILNMAVRSASFGGCRHPCPARRLQVSLPAADQVDAPPAAKGLVLNEEVPA